MNQKYSYFIKDKENPVSAKEDFKKIFCSIGMGVFLLTFCSFFSDVLLFYKNGPFFNTFGYSAVLLLTAFGWYVSLLFGRGFTIFVLLFNFALFCIFKEYYKVNIVALKLYAILSTYKEGFYAGLQNWKSLLDCRFFIYLALTVLQIFWVLKNPKNCLKKALIWSGISSFVLFLLGVFDIFKWFVLGTYLFPNLYMSIEQGLLHKITFPIDYIYQDSISEMDSIIWSGNKKVTDKMKTDNIYLSRIPNFVYLIQVESLTTSAITPKTMPFLYQQKQSAYYQEDKNHYHCLGSANTDFMMMSGLDLNCEKNNYIVYLKYPPIIHKNINSLAHRMKTKGYNTQFFHGFERLFFKRINHYPVMGFDKVYFMEDFDASIPRGEWGVSDIDVFKKALQSVNPSQKNFSFIITAGMHPPYTSQNELYKNPSSDREKYLNAAYELDKGLKLFYEQIPTDSLIVLYGDHNVPDVGGLDTPLMILYKGDNKPQILGEKKSGFTESIYFINSLFENREKE